MNKSLIAIILAMTVLVVTVYAIKTPDLDAAKNNSSTKPMPDTGISSLLPTEPMSEKPPYRVEPRSRYVFDVVLHSVEEIEEMIAKAEQLAVKPRSANEPASIAIVLHGPEVDIFSIRNYNKYQKIVDRAARLDAYNIIDVKMCMTSMRTRGIRNEDVPGFIELVPYGPDEIKKLQQKGFVKL